VLPLVLAIAGPPSCEGREASPRPNVILIVVDTLRADHLSHYGHELPTAEPLDPLRDRATLFTQAYAPAPLTGPSTASLLTGLLPARHGALVHGVRLNGELRTLAEILRDHGWHTAAVSFNVNVSTKTGFDQGFDRFDDHLGRTLQYPDVGEMVEKVRAWLAEPIREPFLLYLQPMNVHGPYRVPKSRRRSLLRRPPTGGFVYYGYPMREIMTAGRLDLRDEVGPGILRSLSEQYDTAIRYTFEELAAILALLESRGRFDESLLVLAADHGEELFDHGGFSHGYSLHREVLHVPLYVKLPGQRRSARVETPVSLVDVVPTLIDALGLEVPRALDGRSLLLRIRAALDGGVQEPPRPLLFQTAWVQRAVERAMLSGRHKLIEIERNYEGLRDAVRLYDVRDDPAEQRDLAARRPDLVESLRREMRDRFRALEERALPAGPTVVEEMDRRRLEALGYLDAEEEAEGASQ
jgi:arylsulfatase A-like enzyme